MSNFELMMNRTDLFKDGKTTLKIVITRYYNNTKTEYEANKTATSSPDQLIYCKALLQCIKMYCCLFKGDYAGYSKYKTKYTDIENDQINRMLFDTDENATLIFRDEYTQTTKQIKGNSEQVRLYTNNVKDNIEAVEFFSKLLFGKI